MHNEDKYYETSISLLSNLYLFIAHEPKNVINMSTEKYFPCFLHWTERKEYKTVISRGRCLCVTPLHNHALYLFDLMWLLYWCHNFSQIQFLLSVPFMAYICINILVNHKEHWHLKDGGSLRMWRTGSERDDHH